MYKRHEKPEGRLIVILVIGQASTGFLLRDLIQVTIVKKPYYLL